MDGPQSRYKVLLDGRAVAWKSEGFSVEPGAHTVRVKIDFMKSNEMDVTAVNESEIAARTATYRRNRGMLSRAALSVDSCGVLDNPVCQPSESARIRGFRRKPLRGDWQ